MAQLDRASGFGPGGCRFESYQAYHFTKNTYKRDFESVNRVKNTTFLQLYKQYIKIDLKYLTKGLKMEMNYNTSLTIHIIEDEGYNPEDI